MCVYDACERECFCDCREIEREERDDDRAGLEEDAVTDDEEDEERP